MVMSVVQQKYLTSMMIQKVGGTIADVDVVISMLPAAMHHLVAEKCIDLRKPMLTASYAAD